MTPYEYYTRRNQLLIGLERQLHNTSEQSRLQHMSDALPAVAKSLDEAYHSMKVCHKTGDPEEPSPGKPL